MKTKSVDTIRFGTRILSLLKEQALTFSELERLTGISRLEIQKTLASLHKHGYIAKNSRELWVVQEQHGKETEFN